MCDSLSNSLSNCRIVWMQYNRCSIRVLSWVVCLCRGLCLLNARSTCFVHLHCHTDNKISIISLSFPHFSTLTIVCCSGRRISSSGRRDLDRIASQVAGKGRPAKWTCWHWDICLLVINQLTVQLEGLKLQQKMCTYVLFYGILNTVHK